jgi:dephospho-CoA kinase
VIDADRVGHEVLADDASAREALVREFGAGILDAGGRIDRSALGERAFRTPEATARLNAIVHPPLLSRLDRRLAEAAEAGHPVVAVDAALLFEFHLDEAMDEIVLVTAPEALRARRLAQSRSLSAERIERLMASQLSDSEKLDDSDYVIVNDGTLEDLVARADEVLEAIRNDIPNGTEEEE